MNPIDEIKEKLRKYPQVKFETEDNYIVVFPISESGFEVGLTVLEDGYRVNFESWYETFEDEGEALNCFAFGLTSACRVKEYCRGNKAYKWRLESEENGIWTEGSFVVLFFYPFWKEKVIRYLQNNLIDEASS